MRSSMQILKVEPSKKVKNRWLVHLENGSLLRVSESDLVAFSLYSGMELDEETLEELSRAAGLSAAKERALNLLTARSLSRKELIKRLVEKEETSEDAEQAADWLEELGLLNDGEYAKTVVQHYAAKGYGLYKIKDELYRRGVPKDIWEDALEGMVDTSDAINDFLRKKLTSNQPDRKELKRVSDALSRRGYSWSEINEALRRYGAETEE
jgi:regulatory protein